MIKETWGNAAYKCYYENNWYIYVLNCQLGQYVGITSNLPHRIESHKAGLCIATAKMGFLSILGSRYIGDYLTASKLERHIHRTDDINIILNPDIAIPRESTYLPDSRLESKVRFVWNS